MSIVRWTIIVYITKVAIKTLPMIVVRYVREVHFYFFPETQCLHVQKSQSPLVDDIFYPLIHTLSGFLKGSTKMKSESIQWKEAYFLHQLPVLDIFFFNLFLKPKLIS